MLNLEERIKDSETHIFKAVFPNTTNHYDTLFGGTAMHMMDEVAFITATVPAFLSEAPLAFCSAYTVS